MNDNLTDSLARVELEEIYNDDSPLAKTDLQAFDDYMERAWELEQHYNKRAVISDYLWKIRWETQKKPLLQPPIPYTVHRNDYHYYP